MPKMKTHRGAAKRFKTTGTGKLLRHQPFDSHLLKKKSSKKKRHLEKEVTVSAGEGKTIKKLLGASAKGGA
jgi:large subunit ribosomal protein L35